MSLSAQGGLYTQLVLKGSGNVGVNTTAPGANLDVKGTLRLSGATSGYVGFSPATAAGSTTYTLPTSQGTIGQVLTTDGVVGTPTLSWTTPSAGGPANTDALLEGSTNLYHTNGRTIASTITAPTLTNSTIGSGDTIQIAFGKLQAQFNNVLSYVLTGYSIGSNAVITAADNILGAFGKLQAQINAHTTTIGNKADLVNGAQSITASNINVTTINGSAVPAGSQWTTSASDIYRASGNVGIGTTSPSTSLEVNGEIKSNFNYIQKSGAYSDGGGAVASNNWIRFGQTGNPYSTISWGRILIKARGRGDEFMTITFSCSGFGNCDIAVPDIVIPLTNPLAANSGVQGVRVVYDGGAFANPAYLDLDIRNDGGSGVTTTQAYLLEGEGISLYGTPAVASTNTPAITLDLKSGTGMLEHSFARGKVVINTAGNIGVGTNNPAYKLDVAGDVNVTGNFKVNGTNISTSGAGTEFVTQCVWGPSNSSISSCTPPACPSGWTDLGISNTITGDATDSSNGVHFLAGTSERGCSHTTTYIVHKMKCPWGPNNSSTTTCTPAACPSGWTDLGLSNTVNALTSYSSVFWPTGNSIRNCIK